VRKIIFTILLETVLMTGYTQAQIVYGVRTGLGLSHVERKINKKTDNYRVGIQAFNSGIFGEKDLFGDFIYGQLGWKYDKIQTDNENYNNKTETIRKTEKLYLYLSLPMINQFLMIVENEGTKSMIGFGGITIGLDYFHSKNQFVHFGFSSLSGGSNRIKRGSLGNDDLETLTSAYISLSNNHKIERFYIGYGLSCARNTFSHDKLSWFLGLPVESVEKSHYALGLVFPTYVQIVKFFKIGVVYRPTFYRPNMTDKFLYEHIISIDFAFKIRLI